MDTRPWCYDHIEDYDLDRSTLSKVLIARAACLSCPRLRRCRADAAELRAAGTPPLSQVLGGVAYGHDGKQRDGRDLVNYFNGRKPERPIPKDISQAS
ncbi:MAG: hypothetical protein WAW17_21605 [Rhodococcus sp. (in: high G+C Gram-positive bacteria)]|uniref:hypothetical protein n=1 Tax=Rhodococcus sp. TaxID=1831 RepID=UPI003BB11A8F